jgi:RHS repeat-associated protein
MAEQGTANIGTDKNASSHVSSPAAVELPKGGGALRGIGEKFSVTPVTGTGSLSIPVYTTMGRSDFAPQLTLSYDSGAGNGIFGFGWNLLLPTISRKTDKGLPRYQGGVEGDVFILSGAEDLVPVLVQNTEGQWELEQLPPRQVGDQTYTIQRYRPRIEGLFARIERWTNQANPQDTFWRSLSTDNIMTWYGRDTNSRITDPTDPTRIFSWLICESHDDKGNLIVYRYKQEDSTQVDLSQTHEQHRTDISRSANRYLKHILYGNHRPYFPELAAEQPWPTLLGEDTYFFEVVFDYGEHNLLDPKPNDRGKWDYRSDPFSSYRAGFEVRTYRLCQRVLMFHHFPDEVEVGQNCLVRSTDFTYSYEANPADVHNPIYSFLLSVTQTGYQRDSAGGYGQKSLPPLEFAYSQPEIDETVWQVDPTSLENLPQGLDGTRYQWVDLDGEGISGILTEQSDGWFYKRNLSPINLGAEDSQHPKARFGPVERVDQKTSIALSHGAQFLDLAGDGQPDLVAFSGGLPGFYERTQAEDWKPFIAFKSLPALDWQNPHMRFIDLNGDGHSDILITEDNCFVWYTSLAENGFGEAERVAYPWDRENGPRLAFADSTQSIYLADMSGDGLTDIVRIRNGQVCYWPNLGYGRFGAKVTMDHAPWFDAPDIFNQRRIVLADIDGSGTTDILYLCSEGVQVYFNQAGNGWSAKRLLRSFPAIDSVASVTSIDLLGNGTACLVWSSPLSSNAQRAMQYIDLMGGQKPHLLIKTVNNLGAETVVRYAPSTKFYLADKVAGKPWITKLPFPVHVVERVETYDHISRNRFVTRYSYHHGYFDGEEREFRGFGLVEQWDTEELAALTISDTFPTGDNIDAASHVPPVHTKTWFHTGIYLRRNHVSDFFAGLLDAGNQGEYYREPGLTDDQARQLLLDDTILPPGLTPEEEREACRALKGSMLRQEVYTLDDTDKAQHPYSVTEQNFTIQVLQQRGENRYGVFFTHAREAINYHYKRNPADPRITHTLTLEVDAFGNVLKEVAIGYGRRQSDPDLPQPRDRDQQSQILVTYTGNRVTNAINAADTYRTPLPSEVCTYELTGFMPTGIAERYQPSDFVQPDPRDSTRLVPVFDSEIPYENSPTTGKQRRLIEQVRTLYRPNDLGTAQNNILALLPLGQMESMAILGESYKLAFTPGLLSKVFQRPRAGQASEALLPNPASVLGGQGADQGGYVDLDGNGHWWIPAERIFYSANTSDTPAQELAYARQHFFLPHRNRDPFSNESFTTYDNYDLLVLENRDPLGNRVTVGERNIAGNVVTQGNDYRVLQPRLLMDPNRNRTAVAFDALGMVVGTAVMGKPEESLGDSLTEFEANLTEAVILAHLANPLSDPQAILQRATTRLVYDLFAYNRTKDQRQPQPAVVYTLARETHDADLTAGEHTKIQHSFAYSDGFGREIQQKIQAEPGPLDLEAAQAATVDPRWVGSGWTIFNNKGNPVRQYEPFFSTTHRFEFARQIGVSPILFYDPMDRVVVTLHPNHTYEKVVFNPWQQVTWDVNDTVTTDPRTDGDIGGYVAAYFATQPSWQTWYDQRQGGAMGPQEQAAANQAAVHAHTPTTAYFDTLGRPFLTLAHNGFAPDGLPIQYPTRVKLDIEGNQRSVTDALDRQVMVYDYDLLGNRIHQASMEAGERWMLNNVAGNEIRRWDSRYHQFRTSYDPLQRPTHQFVRPPSGEEVLVERLVYGEAHGEAARNLRSQLYQHYDQAGVVSNYQFDFKGNLLEHHRQLAREYTQIVNWSALENVTEIPALAQAAASYLESEHFTGYTRYDALNRPIQLVTPHNGATRPNVIQPTYNEANLLEQVNVWLRPSSPPPERLNPATADLQAVTNIDYNAKGQRTLIEYGNQARTRYSYDLETFRLTRLLTIRPQFGETDRQSVQDLRYTYDPVGNITHITDNSDIQNIIFFRNQRVEPSNSYTYDALYRLLEATGREHLGQTGGNLNPPRQSDQDDSFRMNLPHPHDGNAMGTYTEAYEYDPVGNILKMVHQAISGGWTRYYAYDEPSLMEPGKTNNRLSRTSLPGDPSDGPYSARYEHDDHGNMTRMPHLPLMQWDYRDQLQASSKQTRTDGGTPETTFYVYDASGQRVRKVTERQAAAEMATRMKERIYLNGFEIYREYDGAGHAVSLERETLHVMDDQKRIALVETRTQGNDGSPVQVIRYQLGNHLSSTSLELDKQAQIISHEEYTPYGNTTYQAVRRQIEIPKRYRYTGKERDEENGLYYHGARYYAPWLGRWTRCDPSRFRISHENLYVFVQGNPVIFHDPNGKEERVSILSEVIQGDFHEGNTTWTGTVLNVGIGLIPIVGQVADARDTAAAIKNVWEEPNWINVGILGLAAVGWVPLVGDAIKGGGKVGRKVIKEAAEEALEKSTKELAEKTAKVTTAEVIEKGSKEAASEGIEKGTKILKKQGVRSKEILGQEHDIIAKKAKMAKESSLETRAISTRSESKASVGTYRSQKKHHVHQSASHSEGGPSRIGNPNHNDAVTVDLRGHSADITSEHGKATAVQRKLNRIAHGRFSESTQIGQVRIEVLEKGSMHITPNQSFEDLKAFYALRAADAPGFRSGEDVLSLVRRSWEQLPFSPVRIPSR